MSESKPTLSFGYIQNSPTLQRFHASRNRYRLILGPVGCLAGESRIWTERGLERIDVLHQRGEPFRVWSLRDGSNTPTLEWATAPFIKGREKLLKVELSNGGAFRGAAQHLVQLGSGAWTTIQELSHGDQLRSSSGSFQPALQPDDRRCKQTPQDCQDGCFGCYRQHGEQPHALATHGQVFAPSRCGALDAKQYDRCDQTRPRLAHSDTPFASGTSRHSKQGSQDQSSCASDTRGIVGLDQTCVASARCITPRIDQRFQKDAPLGCIGQPCEELAHAGMGVEESATGLSGLTFDSFIGTVGFPVSSDSAELYYDLTVESTGNYIGEFGVVHHNSGKTVACCWEVFHAMHRMIPCVDGVRRSRWAFIRDTAANLKDTTMETWLECFPAKTKQNPFGVTEVIWSDPPSMSIRMPCIYDGGKTTVDAEIFCRHQQQEQDAKNLQSLNLTGYFVNEACQIPFLNIQMLNSRLKRFPPANKLIRGPNGEQLTPRFFGVLDSNMPDDQSWIYRIAEVKKPKLWDVFKQPPAMFRQKNAKGQTVYVPNRGQKIAQGIGAAENIEHHATGWRYYTEQVPPLADAREDWIRVYIMSEYGTLSNGRVVYPDYNDAVHYRDVEIKFDPSRTLFLGFDWGLTPSVLFIQMTDDGQVQIIDEIDGTVPGAPGIERAWLDRIKPKLINEYGWGRGTQIFAIGDPAGNQRNQVTAIGPVKYLAEQGLTVTPCATNAQGERMGAVDHFLHRMAGGGRPALLVSRKAQKTRGGLSQWYYFEKKENCRDDVYAGTPKDNSYTHLQDCLQYVCHALKNPDKYGVRWQNGAGAFAVPVGGGEVSQLACDMSGFGIG